MTSKTIPTYVFFFPYRGVGGVPVLFLRIAEHISFNFKTPVFIVDYADGYMAMNKKNSLIKLINFNENETIQIPNSSILILQSDLPWGIPRNFSTSDDTSIFFWTCFPFNFIPVFPSPIKEITSSSLNITKLVLNTLLLASKFRVKKMIRSLTFHNALVFMDGPNLRTTSYCLDEKFQTPKLLPILLDSPKQPFLNLKSLPSKNSLSFCWIGRIADFKIHILNKVLEDCYIYSVKYQIRIDFYIIGSGDQSANLFTPNEISTLFNIISIDYLNSNDLNQFLIQKINCLFSMGTSALEGAKLAIPTVLLDFSYKAIDFKYRYKFIYQTQEYSLGELVSKNNNYGLTFEEIIHEILINENIGKQCFDYFLTNHSLEKKIDDFLSLSQLSTLSYNNFVKSNNLEKPFFYKLWALIKNLRLALQ